jgi:hypothetical protein
MISSLSLLKNLTPLYRFELQYDSNCIRCPPGVSRMDWWRY